MQLILVYDYAFMSHQAQRGLGIPVASSVEDVSHVIGFRVTDGRQYGTEI